MVACSSPSDAVGRSTCAALVDAPAPLCSSLSLDAAHLLVSYQHMFFYPLMAFGRINLYAQGFIYILSGADKHNYPKTELAGLATFFVWISLVAAAQPSLLLSAGWIFVSHAVSGLLHVQIVLSHWSMETYKGSPYTSLETEWYLMQMRTTMNVATHPVCPTLAIDCHVIAI